MCLSKIVDSSSFPSMQDSLSKLKKGASWHFISATLLCVIILFTFFASKKQVGRSLTVFFLTESIKFVCDSVLCFQVM